MSTVFASQVEGWDDKNYFDIFNDFGITDNSDSSEWGGYRQIPLSNIQNVKGNEEGYTGSPIHYVDMDSSDFYFEQLKYNNYMKHGFNVNKDLINEVMNLGIILPSEEMIQRMINKLRGIANSQ